MKAIIFTGPSLRAMAAGLKSASRRLTGLEEVNKRWSTNPFTFRDGVAKVYSKSRKLLLASVKCPYTVGEERWVRETWAPAADEEETARTWTKEWPDAERLGAPPRTYYEADGGEKPYITKWRPPIYCPRWASRWTVRVTGAGLQCLQEMSAEDALAEGVASRGGHEFGWPGIERPFAGPLAAFIWGWDTMHPEPWACWDANPFVWWFSFEVRRTPAGSAA